MDRKLPKEYEDRVWAVVLGVLAAGAPQSVELSMEGPIDAEMKARVLERLLEKGHRVHPAGFELPVRLSVARAPDHWRVRGPLEDTEAIVVPADPPAVREIEVLQAVTRAVDAIRLPARPEDERTAIVVPDPRALAAEARRPLIVGLFDDGFGLARQARDGDVALCLRSEGTSLRLGASRAPSTCEAGRTVDPARMFDVARQLAVRALQYRPVQATTPAPELAPADWMLTAGVWGGANGRSGGVDPGGGLELRVRPQQVGLSLGFRVVEAGATSIDVIETTLTFGPSLDVPLGSRLRLGAAIRAGMLIHVFSVQELQSGSRVDFLAELPLELGFSLTPRFWMALFGVGGVASEAREQVLGDDVVWSSDWWRATVGFLVAYDFEL